MKKAFIISNAVLGVAVIILFVLQFTGGKKDFSSAPVTGADGKTAAVVYVNIDSLIKGYDMYTDMQKEYEIKAKKKEAEFGSKMTGFQRDAKDFQEKVQKGLVTRSQAQTLQEGLAKREQDLVQMRQQFQSELSEEEGVMLRKIHYSIQDFLKKYNKTKGYSIILSTNTGGPVLYGEDALNITSDVLMGLNAGYKK